MRVLCLHGMGTNSAIFESQTEMFRALLPEHFEYEFFDAEHEYPAAEGCADIFPGPYFCFYPVPTTSNVEESHQYVQEIIDEEGPFDAVMGFSQGGALAASILLRHQKEKPFEPAPFSLAIFISSSLPFWVDTEQGIDVTGLFLRPSESGSVPAESIVYQPWKDDGSADPKPMTPRSRRQGKTEAEIAALTQRFAITTMNEDQWKQILSEAGLPTEGEESDYDSEDDDDEGFQFSPVVSHTDETENSGTKTPLSCAGDIDEDPEDDEFEQKTPMGPSSESEGDHTVRRLHPSVDKYRIGIPTVHIYGSKDPYYRQSLELAKLCEAEWCATYEHPEGHIVPRDKNVNAKIAATIERALRMVEVFSR